MSRFAVAAFALVLFVALLPAAGSVRAADGELIAAMAVSGSPFYPNGDGVREKVVLTIRLARPARLTVKVLDFDGNVVKTKLANADRGTGTHNVGWNGRNKAGKRVADGPYRFRVKAVAGSTVEKAEALLTKARKVIYGARPSAIVVAIDPGHGDVYSEAGRYAPDGSHEKQYNLDIALRLRQMLEGAGVTTVITRTTDQGVNTPEWDRNGDGEVGYADELASRNDAANIGRADVFISNHNNLADNTRVGGPSTYYRKDRVFASENQRLARLVQDNMLARLDLYRTSTWKPSRSHDILSGVRYYVLSPYNPPNLVRPTLMPGVLSEGLFLTHPYELYLLKQPRVRQSMSVAYYDAVQAFIASRSFGVRYEVTADPGAAGPVEPATSLAYEVRLTNSGMDQAVGWKLVAGYVPAATLYDGSGARGEPLGEFAVLALGRGARSTLSLSLPAPPAGDWLLKFDMRLADGRYLSDLGIPVLQLPLSVAEPAP
jgi:N-acetylmuramoyl-L-alanine amidase